MTTVKLYQRPIKNNKITLFLDYYPPIVHPVTRKRTRREFLKLRLFDKPKNIYEKNHNNDTMEIATKIRAERQIAIQERKYGVLPNALLKLDAVEYFKQITDEKKDANYGSWLSAYNYFKKFTGGVLKFSELDEKFCEDFKAFLLSTKSFRETEKKLHINSASSYFSKFMAFLKIAYKKGILSIDLNSLVSHIKPIETHREYLTNEELDKLVKTDCEISILKKAALFSALTGLRHCDIKNMKWGDVYFSESNGYSLHFSQQKTKAAEFLPISNLAFKILGERGEPNELLFKGLKYSAYHNNIIEKWLLKAGITKHITFHCFRHTFATLQLTMGTNILTVSKMLGHKDLKTTMIYAKIVDDLKIQAANRIILDI